MADALEIKPFDPNWSVEFEAERVRLEATLGKVALRIDHNGSTAVPGLAAKPIIDIQVSVRKLKPSVVYSGPLESAGYVHLPHPDDSFAPFFYRPAVGPHTHHVHVVEAGGEEERKTLAFRDYLREHAEIARKYEALKRELAARYSSSDLSNHQAYADAKSEFVAAVTRQAIAEGYPQDPTILPVDDPSRPDNWWSNVKREAPTAFRLGGFFGAGWPFALLFIASRFASGSQIELTGPKNWADQILGCGMILSMSGLGLVLLGVAVFAGFQVGGYCAAALTIYLRSRQTH